MNPILPPLTKRAHTEVTPTLPLCEPSRPFPFLLVGCFFFLACAVALIGAGAIVSLAERSSPPEVVVYTNATAEGMPLSYGPRSLFSLPPFFESVRDAFIAQERSLIEADLAQMRIRYYHNGAIIFEAPIRSKGRRGSWWETPSGLYAVQSKSVNHISSFSGVHQPWSMVFQGNFFIHGWPRYADGSPVAEGYSGGCIRLADEDAQTLYNLVSVGTPVLVHESIQDTTPLVPPKVPANLARAFIVADVESGTVLVEQASDEVLPIASITKLMTALVAADYINFSRNVVITETMLASTSIPRLTSGMQMSAYSLLFPLLLESSNEAGEALAHVVGRGRFITLMNEKARALGMEGAFFTDPTGVEAENRARAVDLLTFARHLYESRRAALFLSAGVRDSTLYTIYPFSDLENFNPVPGIPEFIGGKIGKSTAAGETALLLYTMELYGTPRPVVFIVLGADDAHTAVAVLYRHVAMLYGASSHTTR